MPRIAVDIDALVEDFLAQLCLASRRGKWTPAFFRTARVKTERKEPEQIRDGLWFEYRRVNAGFEHSRTACIECFTNRFVGDTRSIEFGNVEMITQEVTGAAAVRCARGRCQTHQTRSFVSEVSVLCCRCSRGSTRLVKTRANDFRFFTRSNHIVDCLCARGDGNVRRRFRVAIHRLVSLLTQRRYVLAIDR